MIRVVMNRLVGMGLKDVSVFRLLTHASWHCILLDYTLFPPNYMPIIFPAFSKNGKKKESLRIDTGDKAW